MFEPVVSETTEFEVSWQLQKNRRRSVPSCDHPVRPVIASTPANSTKPSGAGPDSQPSRPCQDSSAHPSRSGLCGYPRILTATRDCVALKLPVSPTALRPKAERWTRITESFHGVPFYLSPHRKPTIQKVPARLRMGISFISVVTEITDKTGVASLFRWPDERSRLSFDFTVISLELASFTPGFHRSGIDA